MPEAVYIFLPRRKIPLKDHFSNWTSAQNYKALIELLMYIAVKMIFQAVRISLTTGHVHSRVASWLHSLEVVTEISKLGSSYSGCRKRTKVSR